MLNKLEKALKKSPINYFSDLFIAAMVVVWIIAIIAMMVFAIYSTLVWADNSIWSDLGTLVGLPLSCGGAIWMIKNGVQHKIAAQRGEQCKYDFPAVNDDIYDTSKEEPLDPDEDEDEEEEFYSSEGNDTDIFSTSEDEPEE